MMKILIVDDEIINRTLLVNMLHNAGYDHCLMAESGEDALLLFEQERPDLVLLDVVMPNMSGFDVARQLRMSDEGPYLPILFITALEDNESLVRCLEVGGNDFATKPFDRHILIAKIRAHLRIRSLSQFIEKQNQRLRMYKQRVAREHAIVEHIFSHAIVNSAKVLSYFDCCLKPAETFNGDVFLCEASPNGGIYFLVGDFTGHGLASAIGALPVTHCFQELSQKGSALSEFVVEINRVLIKYLPADMFMAAVIGEINAEGNSVSLWQGGMPAVIVSSAEQGDIHRFSSRHMALGILEPHELDTSCDTIQLNIGQQLIICSDGLIEREDASGAMLFEEGLIALISQEVETTGSVSAQSLFQSVTNHASKDSLDDDVTLVIFTAKPIEIEANGEVDEIPSFYEMALNAKHLKQPDILNRILQVVAGCEGIERVRSIVYTVLTELFNNALDHGVLELDSSLKSDMLGFEKYYALREASLNELVYGSVRVQITSRPDQEELLISVEDSGNGFEWERETSLNHDNAHGRGLALLHSLSKSVVFEKNGSKVNCLLDTKGG